MSKLLVHLVSGPEHPTRAALALLVAREAVGAGHEVKLFLAGDAVQLLRGATAAAVHGVGTGSFAEHWAALVEAGVELHASGMSSKAREVDVAAASGGVQASPPATLVELALWADSTLVY